MSSYYVCNKDGNDENVGDEVTPFKTINRASLLAKPGDTIIVKPGIYRERVIPNKSGYRSNPITYKSLEKNKAIIRGSIEWKPEKEENNLLIGSLDSSVFTDDSHYDGPNPFLIKCCVTPFKREGAPETKIKEIRNSDPNMFYCLGQVFVDDDMYLQCPYKDEMEKKELMQSLSIENSSLDQFISIGFNLLNLITYFTSGEKETKAWTILKDSEAPKAAGVIHSDFEKGFIAAEVINYKKLLELGSEKNAKFSGKIRTEGKDYIVKDGDVILFRFNV